MRLAPTAAPSTVPFAAHLAAFGDRVALRTPEHEITYAALAGLVSERAATLGPTRRLVLLAGANHVEALVTYLAALSAGHPVILVPGDNPGNLSAVVDAYDPDVVAGPGGGIAERRAGTAHDLHPDLALLLSTSGSTGSPKLVRLSAENVRPTPLPSRSTSRSGPPTSRRPPCRCTTATASRSSTATCSGARR